MRNGRVAAGLAAGTVVLLLAACQQGPLPPAGTQLDPPEPPRQTLASALRQCTIDHEYDPRAADGLAPDALGEGEAEWRECVHAAMERLLRPRLREPDALDGLIAEDQRQTEAIAGGTATRAERTAALQARLAVMRTHEQVLRQEELSEMSAGDLLGALHGGADGALQALDDDLSALAEAL